MLLITNPYSFIVFSFIHVYGQQIKYGDTLFQAKGDSNKQDRGGERTGH